MMLQLGITERKLIPHVIAVQGLALGEGKSITLVALAYIAYRCGYTVYSNMRSLNFPHKDFYKDILPNLDAINSEEMDAPQFAFYALDDVNKMWESRRAMDAAVIALSDFMQDVRKTHSMMAYSIPQHMWTDTRLYDVCDLVLNTMFDQGSNTLTWIPFDPNTKTVFGPLQMDASPLFGLYDTFEKIRTPTVEQFYGEKSKEPTKEGNCPGCHSKQFMHYNIKTGLKYCSRCGWRSDKDDS
jgi:hypothetical protein